MELTRKEFDVLVLLSENNNRITQRTIQTDLNYSLGTINKVINDLTDKELISNYKITAKGLKVLEQYRVKKAIFIAAGLGSRLYPITNKLPKPLVLVNGKRIIETLLDACINVGIEEIYIVRGYMKEKFDQLLEKYPNIKFIDNEYYNETNNISSAFLAKDLMENAYVFESDLFLINPNIIKKYHYNSDVLGIYKNETDDWCFEDKKGFVTAEKIGGKDCYQMVGIYYWNKEDGKKLSFDLDEAYNMPGGKERYWETVPNQVYRGKYKVEIIPCNEDDIVEIDTVKELIEMDKSYKKYE